MSASAVRRRVGGWVMGTCFMAAGKVGSSSSSHMMFTSCVETADPASSARNIDSMNEGQRRSKDTAIASTCRFEASTFTIAAWGGGFAGNSSLKTLPVMKAARWRWW